MRRTCPAAISAETVLQQRVCGADRYSLGIMYPAFMSFKSLDSGDAAGTGYWLTYWIVWSCMTVLEVFEAVALYIPFYYELKLALVIWLIHPQSKGAEVCFKQFVQPLLKKHEKDIDDGLTHLQVCSSIAEHATLRGGRCSQSVAFVNRRGPGSTCQHCARKQRRQASSFHLGKVQLAGLSPRVATRACDNEVAAGLVATQSRQILRIRKLAFQCRYRQYRTKTTTSSLGGSGRLNAQQSLDTLQCPRG
eukprot:COSAG02_NODE_7534_length_2970_cov_3.220132_3_plen_249_part_00